MIDLIADADQQAVADTIAGFLKRRLPGDRHTRAEDGTAPMDRETWRELAQIGCFALSLPESVGGLGLTLVEEVLASREYGRHLASPSLLATVLAGRLAYESGDTSLAARFAGGDARAALALQLPRPDSPPASEMHCHVFDRDAGDYVLAWSTEGLRLIEPDVLSIARTLICVDESLRMELGVADLGKVPWPAAHYGPSARTGLLLVASQLTGIAEAVRDMAVTQANTRQQFGQPIGTFQAIKHRCADMALRAEAAWSQTVYAALVERTGAPDGDFQVAAAKLVATDAARAGAADNIQVHGGMGFTAEISAHLFLKRALLLNQVGGDARYQQGRLVSYCRAP